MSTGASPRAVLGIFGGTFDPIHIGHLRTVFEIRHRLGMDRFHFIPASIPPHRPQPAASAELRLRMLEAALADQVDVVVDRREIDREGTSYSIDTARSLRAEFPDHALCLVLGMDAFLGLTAWRDWERLLSLVNLVVARRPGVALPHAGILGRLLAEHRVSIGAKSDWRASGQIVIQDVTQLEIAATDLRVSIRQGLAPKYLVPDAVWEIISASGCYAARDE